MSAQKTRKTGLKLEERLGNLSEAGGFTLSEMLRVVKVVERAFKKKIQAHKDATAKKTGRRKKGDQKEKKKQKHLRIKTKP